MIASRSIGVGHVGLWGTRGMDKIELPILPATMPLKAALDLLRLMDRSALVMAAAAGGRLILDRSALLGRGSRAETPLGEIAGARPLPRLTGSERSLGEETAYALDAAGTLVGIGETQDGSATIYTRHEGVAAEFRLAIGYCYCSGPEREICAPGDYPGGYCDLGHPIRCTSA